MNLPSLSALAVIASLCTACSTGNNASYLERTAAAAKDHIMLVRSAPPTFGFQRLTALSEAYPDLGIFIRQTGQPDFLAETKKGENRYLILYYTVTRKAFACRTGAGRSRQVEFSGPYPITDGELRTLQGLRARSEAP
jgi:hypothetical protein